METTADLHYFLIFFSSLFHKHYNKQSVHTPSEKTAGLTAYREICLQAWLAESDSPRRCKQEGQSVEFYLDAKEDRMAQVKVNVFIEWVDYRLKNALEEAVTNVMPGVLFDKDKLWKEFVGVVNRKCSVWAKVPDTYVRKR